MIKTAASGDSQIVKETMLHAQKDNTMSPIGQILSFAQKRDPWQQDLIRRIYTQGGLSPTDQDHGLQMLKAHYGLLPPDQAPCPECLKESHTPPNLPEMSKVTLNSLGEVKHVNRLAENQNLPFAVNGMTIIYGHNGSGKSGYCRLLKKLCRVRVGAEESILGNAFDKQPSPPAEVTVRFSVGQEQPSEIRWHDGELPPRELGQFSVFDTKTVPIYANKANELEFLPQGLDILPKLGTLCQSLGGRIDAEIRTLETQIAIPLPQFSANTKVAAAVCKLVSTTPIRSLPTASQLQELGSWDQAAEQELGRVETSLKSDAQALALRSRQLKLTVEQLKTDLENARATVGDDAIRKLIANVRTAQTARAAAALAATTAFQKEPLPGVGSEPWRQMFEYARQYSQIAYPDLPFPVTGSGKVCVLCQQLLDPEATERFKRFDAFIKDTAEVKAKELEQALTKQINAFSRFTLRAHTEIETLLLGIESVDPASIGLGPETAAFFKALSSRQAEVVKKWKELKNFADLPLLPAPPVSKLTAAADRLDHLVQRYESARKPEQRKALEQKRDELQAHKKLSEHLQTALVRRNHLITLSKLKECKGACDTNLISRKNTELRKEFITEEFERKLNDEIGKFGLGHLPLKIHERSGHGLSFLGVSLDTFWRIQNKDILSDGEFRALALACFLTEINSTPYNCGIILDDPVSSLDHVRTRRVAVRLVEEAKKRQVIIFTHDLVFYYELWMAAAEAQVPLVRHWMRITNEHGFGTVLNKEEPWQAKRVAARLQHLEENGFPIIRSIQDRTGDEYRLAVMDFYTGLRETWERLVEELLFNGVVTRFQAGVMTQSLRGVQVEDEDYRQVYFGMKRASEFSGHDRTRARQIAFPDPNEIKKDLEELRSYAKGLKARTKSLEETRTALEKPPEARLV